MDVRVRELRDTLSKQLAKVKGDHTVTVTEHGKVVARIVPADSPTRLEQLIAEGKVALARRPKGGLPKPIRVAGMVSDLVQDQRR